MASRRRSTALFEVIHSGQRSGGSGALRTPLWWFKSKFSGVGSAAAPVSIPHEPQNSPAAVSSSPARIERSSGRSAVHFDFDRERQEITLCLHYTTAIISAFAILVTIGLAYAVGRHIAGGPAPAYAAATTDELRQMPATPGALDVVPRDSLIATNSHPAGPLTLVKPANPQALPPTLPPSTGGVEINQARSIGLNYILVQSYPNEKLATEARDFLVKSGIPCTVEKGPKDWASDPAWCSVITTAGYQHIHSPEYEAAAKNITTLSEQFAGKGKFKRFEPHPYKWKQLSVS